MRGEEGNASSQQSAVSNSVIRWRTMSDDKASVLLFRYFADRGVNTSVNRERDLPRTDNGEIGKLNEG